MKEEVNLEDLVVDGMIRLKLNRIWWGNLKEGVNLEDLVVDGTIRLK